MSPTLLSFSQVLNEMLANEDSVYTRKGWNSQDQWIALQVPDVNSKMTKPYIYIRTVQGDLIPWLASQSDMLAFDWFLNTEAD